MAKNETPEEARMAAKEAEHLFRMNLDTTFMKVVNKMAGINDSDQAASGIVDPQAARKQRMQEAGMGIDGPADHHMDWESVLSKAVPGYTPQTNKSASRNYAGAPATISLALADRSKEKFSPIVNELSRFKFSATEEGRNEQVKEIVAALRVTLRKMAAKSVAKNTKQLYENMDKFFTVEGGFKATFNVGNTKVAMIALGDFTGDEILCLEQHGTDVSGYVARQAGDDFRDVSVSYNIKLELAQ